MTEIPSYEKPLLKEGDVEKIKGEVERLKIAPTPILPPVYHETVKEAVKNIKEEEEIDVLPDYAKDSPEEVKIEAQHLFSSALKDGLAVANRMARKAHPSVADMFHDAMAKHYMELEEKGLIK